MKSRPPTSNARSAIKPHWPLNFLIWDLVIGIFLPALLLFVCTGCNILGPVGAVTARAFPPTIEASYKGLSQQTVVVMVWADRGIRTDNPNLQLDLASGFQQKLVKQQTDEKPKELEGLTFPVGPESVARYQEDHPEMEFQGIATTAVNFNKLSKATRLIYIEVSDFSLHPEQSQALHLGSITGSIKIFEVAKGNAKEAWKESDIRVSFPKDSPPEGLPLSTDYKTYQGTLDLFTTELAKRLYPHIDEED